MNSKEKNFQDFLECVSRLEPVEYCGLCKIMCVPLYNQNNEPRAFDVTLKEVMDKFTEMPRKPRRQLMKVLKSVGGKKNGTSA